jgi:hypothetical protein
MFHLPREIIQLIFEFDSTYREEYDKSLKIINSFPAYMEVFKIENENSGYKYAGNEISLFIPSNHYKHFYLIFDLPNGF